MGMGVIELLSGLASRFVPYTGATADLNLGARNLKMPSGVIQDALSTSSLSPNARQLYNESGTTVAQWGSYGGYLFLNAGLSTDNIIDSTGGSAIGVGNKSLIDGASTSLSWSSRITYDTSGVDSINWEFRRLLDSSANTSVDYSNYQLISGGASSLSWSGRIAYDGVGVASLSWGGRELSNSLGRTVYSYELNLMYAFSGVQHAVIDVGNQILYDIADQSSIRWSTRDMYASDGSTVLANYTNSTGMRFYGTVGAGFSSASFTPSARIHAHSLTGIATYQKTTNSATGALSTDGFDVGISSTGVAEIRQREALAMELYTSNTLRMTVSSTGGFIFAHDTQVADFTNSTGRNIRFSSGNITPLTNNVSVLGGTSNMFSQMYSTTYFAGLGAVGTPTYTFNGDTNTGIYSAGADIINVATAGVERLRIDASGNSGFGTGALVSARVHSTSTTEQLRLSYDTSNYCSTTVSSTGVVTLDAVGTGASFIFSDAISFPTTTISANTTLGGANYTARVDATGAARIITLPAASGCTGRIYNIKKIDASANTVTIDGNASETIDGALTVIISVRYQNVQIQSNGTGWDIL